MVLVDITASVFRLFAPSRGNTNFAAVWNTKQLLVMRVNKTDTFFCIADMLVEPFLDIAIAVKIIIALCGITAEQIGILFGIHTEAVLGTVVSLKGTIGETPCILAHSRAVLEQTVFFGTQSIDNLVKLGLKFVRFPLRSVVAPSGIKAITARVEVATKMTDIACLSCYLHTLGIGVVPFIRCNRSYFHISVPPCC